MKFFRRFPACLLVAILAQTQHACAAVTRPTFMLKSYPLGATKEPMALGSIVSTRGGASRRSTKNKTRQGSRTATGKKKVGAKAEADKAKSSAIGDTMAKYKKILPLTRIYITMVGSATLLGLILGDELTQGLLAFNPMRVLYGLELWRPFTAASFLGPPSIGWLMSGYYLFEYGSSLERAYGTAQHLIFLLTELVVLSTFSAVLGMPFFAASMITAMLHVLSRSMPNQKVKWLIFTVPYWTLPYGLMASDVLQAGNAMAAMPHIVGILAGHFYHFNKFIWPKVGGEDWLVAPDFLVQRFDPNARKSKDNASSALKSKRRGKGRKLGT